MKKLITAALLMLAGLTGIAGCRICASPYDDCYPVIEDQYPQAHQMPASEARDASLAQVLERSLTMQRTKADPTQLDELFVRPDLGRHTAHEPRVRMLPVAVERDVLQQA